MSLTRVGITAGNWGKTSGLGYIGKRFKIDSPGLGRTLRFKYKVAVGRKGGRNS